MKALSATVFAAILGATLLVPAGAAPADSAWSSAQVPGEKIDSGLGDLPHYRDWKDPTGKAPLGK
jgi:hypothetical protein